MLHADYLILIAPTSSMWSRWSFTSSSRPEGIFLSLSLKGFGSVTSILCLAASVHPISSSSSVKISWYSANKLRALFVLFCPGLKTRELQLFKQDFSSLLNGEFDTTFLDPSSSSKCSNCTICHHHLRNLIGSHYSGNSSSFLDNDGMVLGITELNSHPLTATIVCTIIRTYMQSLRESFVGSMKWLHHDVHAFSHQN